MSLKGRLQSMRAERRQDADPELRHASSKVALRCALKRASAWVATLALTACVADSDQDRNLFQAPASIESKVCKASDVPSTPFTRVLDFQDLGDGEANTSEQAIRLIKQRIGASGRKNVTLLKLPAGGQALMTRVEEVTYDGTRPGFAIDRFVHDLFVQPYIYQRFFVFAVVQEGQLTLGDEAQGFAMRSGDAPMISSFTCSREKEREKNKPIVIKENVKIYAMSYVFIHKRGEETTFDRDYKVDIGDQLGRAGILLWAK